MKPHNRTLMKSRLFYCLCLALLLASAICNAQILSYSKQTLDGLVSELNKRCPVSITEGLKIKRVTVDHNSKVVFINFDCEIAYESLSSSKQREFRQVLESLVDEYDEIMQRDAKAGKKTLWGTTHALKYTLRCRFYSSSQALISELETPSQSSTSRIKDSKTLSKAEQSFQKRDFADAEKQCRKAIEKDNYDWHSYLVLYLIDKELNRDGRENLKRYLLYNSQAEAYRFNGKLYNYDDVVNEFAAQVYRLIKRQSSSLATRKIYSNRLEEVSIIAIDKISNKRELLSNLTYSFCLTKEYEKALWYANQATEVNQELGFFLLGYVYGHEGRKTLAQNAYESVLKINPNHKEALWNLANQYFNPKLGVPYNANDSNFQKSLQLRIRAARAGSSGAIEWCKKNDIDW